MFGELEVRRAYFRKISKNNRRQRLAKKISNDFRRKSLLRKRHPHLLAEIMWHRVKSPCESRKDTSKHMDAVTTSNKLGPRKLGFMLVNLRFHVPIYLAAVV